MSGPAERGRSLMLPAAGTVAQGRIMWFENRTRGGRFDFVEHGIEVVPVDANGAALVVNGFTWSSST